MVGLGEGLGLGSGLGEELGLGSWGVRIRGRVRVRILGGED